MPDQLSFDPRSPDEIKGAYLSDVRRRTLRLRGAMSLAMVATTMVIGCFFAVSWSRTPQPSAAFTTPSVVITESNGKATLAITGIFNTASVGIRVVPAMKGLTSNEPFAFTLAPHGNGTIQTALPLDPSVAAHRDIRVVLEWVDRGGATFVVVPKPSFGRQETNELTELK